LSQFKKRPKPVLLCILDGWGIGTGKDDAIAAANTPNLKKILSSAAETTISTSGLDVGLPKGQMGNSEVGHMNIGSGRVVMQSLPRIDLAIKDGSINKNPALVSFIEKLKKSGGAAHLMGLVSDGGVHSHISHIIALAQIISDAGIKTNIHAFLDGRDTPPESAISYIKQLEKAISPNKLISIATIAGRYYPMDRDNRWERVKLAYDAMVEAKGPTTDNPLKAIEESYNNGKVDEFVIPTIIKDYSGMKDGDGLLMANFRADRARQILTALLAPDFKNFDRKHKISFACSLGMVEYSEELNKYIPALFSAQPLNNILGKILSDAGLTQLRIAETEKYAHVTFFFNGGAEDEFPGEERILVPSPQIATYDMQPEMSAKEVTDKLVDAIKSDKYDFIVVNYANTDMVGHTGDMKAAIKAVEAVDSALGRLNAEIDAKGGIMLITADHGNAEVMVDPKTGEPHTAHTTNLVPLIITGISNLKLKSGRLCDIAPTILKLINLKKPDEMTGEVLISS